MPDPTLRELVQAVVDEWESHHQGRERPTGVQDAYDILAALNAERNAADAQGYARAMGEVEAKCDHGADYTGWSDYAMGYKDALERLAVWVRERAAAAEKEREG